VDAKQCDRCRQFYIDDGKAGKPALRLDATRLVEAGHLRNADLCASCIASLWDWWNGDTE
jgi:hypothetical protein